MTLLNLNKFLTYEIFLTIKEIPICPYVFVIEDKWKVIAGLRIDPLSYIYIYTHTQLKVLNISVILIIRSTN